MDVEFTKDDMEADFGELKDLELELSRDEIDAVRRRLDLVYLRLALSKVPCEEEIATGAVLVTSDLPLSLTYRHSEICASYGASKCLMFMEENEMPISPLVNLYAIQYGKPIVVNVAL
jgi:hypothetical protein